MENCKEPNILEIGCGKGSAAEFTNRLPGNLLLVDIDPDSIAFLKERWISRNDISVRQTSSARLRGTFDVVYYFLSLHHIADIVSEIENAKRLVCDKGKLFICEMEPRNDARFHKYDTVPYDGISIDYLSELLPTHGFRVTDYHSLAMISGNNNLFSTYCLTGCREFS